MRRLVSAGCGFLLIALGGCVERLIIDGPGLTGDSESDSEADDAPIDDDFDPNAECNEPKDCSREQTCFEGTCVGTGEFRISLSWQFVSDLDLHVRTPEGVEIWFEQPNTGGGRLDVDDCVSGSCRNNLGVHVENVFFAENAPRGTYEIWVVNFDGRRGGTFGIEVEGVDGFDKTFADEIPGTQAESSTFTFDY